MTSEVLLRPAGTLLRVPVDPSPTDPSPLFELFRGSYATELLVAATAHLGVFRLLEKGPMAEEALRTALGLAPRAFRVLTTALRAMGTLTCPAAGVLGLTPLASTHLVSSSPCHVGDYFSLAAGSPGVHAMVERLRTNRPAVGDSGGVAFIYREGLVSAMDAESGARFFTLALSGRARNVAPVLAEQMPLAGARLLVDVGGGTGVYSIALLRANPDLKAVVWDRPEVLRVAAEFAAESGVSDRLDLRGGDMFADPFPVGADVVLLSNILHDWDEPECLRLLRRCAEGLPPGGRLLIHDVFLDDDLGGPLPIALYSAALFSVTEGRAYSIAEYRRMLEASGFGVTQWLPTRVHCGVLVAVRREG
jgi:SAM-dependent methyltransferase